MLRHLKANPTKSMMRDSILIELWSLCPQNEYYLPGPSVFGLHGQLPRRPTRDATNSILHAPEIKWRVSDYG